MKIGDYVYGMAFYSGDSWPTRKKVSGNIINITEDRVILWGVFQDHWIQWEQVIVGSLEDFFDNHYDRNKKYKL